MTNTVAVAGNRDLTSFNLGTNYAGATFNFVPNGSAVTVTRDVIRTQSCNTCHDSLAFHGGYAQGMPMCVLCHQPQNADPTDRQLAGRQGILSQPPHGFIVTHCGWHQDHARCSLQIIGYMNSVNDFSTVVDPAMTQRCEVCHTQTSATLKTTGGSASHRISDQAFSGGLWRVPQRYRFRNRLFHWSGGQPPGWAPGGRHAVRQLPYPAG